MKETVAILGASDRPDRFAYKAFKMLADYGHRPVPVNPHLKNIENTPVVASLEVLQEKIDTLTMYVGPKISDTLTEDILRLKPKRVIFNPGSENPNLRASLEDAGIAVIEGCTLVMLKTNHFEI